MPLWRLAPRRKPAVMAVLPLFCSCGQRCACCPPRHPTHLPPCRLPGAGTDGRGVELSHGTRVRHRLGGRAVWVGQERAGCGHATGLGLQCGARHRHPLAGAAGKRCCCWKSPPRVSRGVLAQAHCSQACMQGCLAVFRLCWAHCPAAAPPNDASPHRCTTCTAALPTTPAASSCG